MKKTKPKAKRDTHGKAGPAAKGDRLAEQFFRLMESAPKPDRTAKRKRDRTAEAVDRVRHWLRALRTAVEATAVLKGHGESTGLPTRRRAAWLARLDDWIAVADASPHCLYNVSVTSDSTDWTPPAEPVNVDGRAALAATSDDERIYFTARSAAMELANALSDLRHRIHDRGELRALRKGAGAEAFREAEAAKLKPWQVEAIPVWRHRVSEWGGVCTAPPAGSFRIWS